MCMDFRLLMITIMQATPIAPIENIDIFHRPTRRASCPKKLVPKKYPKLSGTKTKPSCHFYHEN